MLKNKKMVLKYTTTSMVLEALGFLLFTAVLVFAVSRYPGAPELVPNNYTLSGEIIDWAGREASLIHCILAVFMYIIFTGLGTILRRISPHNNEHSALGTTLLALLLIKAVYMVSALLKTHYSMSALPMPTWAVLVLPASTALIILGTVFVIYTKHTRKTCKA